MPILLQHLNQEIKNILTLYISRRVWLKITCLHRGFITEHLLLYVFPGVYLKKKDKENIIHRNTAQLSVELRIEYKF